MKLCLSYHQALYTWTWALRTLFVYIEFTKKKNFFGQLTLAVAFSAPSRHGSWITECDVTWRTVKVELLSSGNNYPRDISYDFWF